jgi:hypothetical protein
MKLRHGDLLHLFNASAAQAMNVPAGSALISGRSVDNDFTTFVPFENLMKGQRSEKEEVVNFRDNFVVASMYTKFDNS